MKQIKSASTLLVSPTGLHKVEVGVSEPTVAPAKKLTQEDVWGKWKEDSSTLVSRGLIVAQGYDGKIPSIDYLKWKQTVQVPSICPVWNDRVPYKSVTVICQEDQFDDVYYWLEYVHGANSVVNVKHLLDGRVALRSDYQCW